ncbi:hypothetical protein ACI3P6_11660, partial [Lacticaseibacillus paracasei]|uniref:hypothetical protein n=1 Tax=Lacticaseibacillus paracasei TaxID=1597 RepID=UPI003853A952
FAGSKRRHSVPAPAGRRLRSLARQENFSPAPSYDYSSFNESQVLRGNDGPHFSRSRFFSSTELSDHFK